MRKRKLLLHLGFWTAYLAPGLIEQVMGRSRFPSTEALFAYSASLVLQAVTIFYLFTEVLLPFCTRVGKRKRLVWISVPILWLSASYGNMWLESILHQCYFPDKPPGENAPGFWDYTLGMFWFMVIATGITLGHLWYENQLKIKDIQNLQMRTELDYLRYRVNPHFLFNTLNNIYALALEKSENAAEVILRLAELMRYMLQEENQKVPLRSELELLQNYLELEKMRLGEHVKINMSIQGEINGQLIAPMLLLPFIENGFKHGANNSFLNGYVEIFVRVNGYELFFYVENNKNTNLPLFAPEPKLPSGLGLANVRRRLELLYGNACFHLETEDGIDKYTVNLYLNLK